MQTLLTRRLFTTENSTLLLLGNSAQSFAKNPLHVGLRSSPMNELSEKKTNAAL
jgi:hypothetical protein